MIGHCKLLPHRPNSDRPPWQGFQGPVGGMVTYFRARNTCGKLSSNKWEFTSKTKSLTLENIRVRLGPSTCDSTKLRNDAGLPDVTTSMGLILVDHGEWLVKWFVVFNHDHW